MATAAGFLKNIKVKIKDPTSQEQKSEEPMEESKVNNEENSGSSPRNQIKEEEKERGNLELSDNENESEENSSSQSPKKVSEEKKNSNTNNNIENKSSLSKENSNEENYNETDNVNLNNNQENNNNVANNSNLSQNNNNSSFLNSNHYNALRQNNQEEELERINYTSPGINRENPFLTKGKFMQIQPHFGIFNRQVNDLQNGLYENTKKCLIYKSSLQQSENLIREQADNVTRELVDKIFNLRQLFFGANRAISMTINEVNNNMLKVKQSQIKLKKEIHECDRRINACESQVGYKLLGKTNYSFMKRYNSTLTQ